MRWTKKAFFDVGNGKWDIDETYIDQVDGVYQKGETFWDCNKNGKYDLGIDSLRNEYGNGKYDYGESFTDLGNGVYDLGEEFTDRNKNGKWEKELLYP